MSESTSIPIGKSQPLRPRTASRTRMGVPVRLLKGRAAILRAQPMLAGLARRTAQTGQADDLDYFLHTPDARRKRPYLLLLGRRGRADQAVRPRPDGEGVAAAVLLFEYRLGPMGTRVFATSDSSGRRNILAAPEDRARVAAQAMRALVERGAEVVHLAFSETHMSADGERMPVPLDGTAQRTLESDLRFADQGAGPRLWTFQEREIPMYLNLYSHYEETLAAIGQRTRANLRYYRRRCELELGCVFVPEAKVSLTEFLHFNRECSFAVDDRTARIRYEAMSRVARSFLRGVHDRNGRWLSLAGGRLHERFSEIDWQMNRADLPSSSLSTVLRAYLIEHEVRRGATRLYIEGGTPHPIGRSFARERVLDLTGKRMSMPARMLEHMLPRVAPAKNYVMQLLTDPDAVWTPW